MSDAVYDVRLSGLVPMRDLLREFGESVAITHEMRTVVTRRFGDQADLHGFLHRLRASGLEVVEVRRVAPENSDEALDGHPVYSLDVRRGGPT